LNLRKQIFTHFLLTRLPPAEAPAQLDLCKHHAEVLIQQPGMTMILTSLSQVEFNIGLCLLPATTQLKRAVQKAEMGIPALAALVQK
jgi:hypothetical protein